MHDRSLHVGVHGGHRRVRQGPGVSRGDRDVGPDVAAPAAVARRHEPARFERGTQRAIQLGARKLRGVQPDQVGQVSQVNPRLGRERMGRRQQDSGDGTIGELQGLDSGHRPGGHEGGGDVDAVLSQGGVLIYVVHPHHAHRRFGRRLPERCQQVEQDRRVHVEIAVRELEPCRRVGPPGGGHRARRAFERAAGVAEKLLACPRHPRAARQPLKQLDAHFPLQIADLLRERRLRHPQPARGPEEAALLGDRDEVSQVT